MIEKILQCSLQEVKNKHVQGKNKDAIIEAKANVKATSL